MIKYLLRNLSFIFEADSWNRFRFWHDLLGELKDKAVAVGYGWVGTISITYTELRKRLLCCDTSLWCNLQGKKDCIRDKVDKESFENTSRWVEYIREERGNSALIYLVGNKIDLVDKR